MVQLVLIVRDSLITGTMNPEGYYRTSNRNYPSLIPAKGPTQELAGSGGLGPRSLWANSSGKGHGEPTLHPSPSPACPSPLRTAGRPRVGGC